MGNYEIKTNHFQQQTLLFENMKTFIEGLHANSFINIAAAEYCYR